MQSAGDDSGPFPYRILFVDDDLRLAGLYADLLRARGYVVHVANGGFEALACLRQALPDLVISDLCMPGMSGMELLAIIRQRFPHLPLLAISAADILSLEANAADVTINRGDEAMQQLLENLTRLLRPRHAGPIALPGRLPWVARRSMQELWLTCSECLRSFRASSEAVARVDRVGIHTCTCVHCGHAQPFLIGDDAA